VGSHVVDKLAEMQCEVWVVDNLFTGKIENLQLNRVDRKVRFFDGDIRDGGLVNKLVKEVDAIVHLAAISSVPFSVENPVLTNDVNVNGTLNLLNACLDADVRRFLFISSCAVYGEPRYFPMDERHPIQPLSPYAASKAAAEGYCKVFRKVYGLDAVVLRLFNVYGSRQREEDSYCGVITKFVSSLLHGKPLVIFGDGNQMRDFVYVEDVAEAIWLALESEAAAGETFNIGSGRPTSINELAKLVTEVFGDEAEMVYEEERIGDLRQSCADIAKAERTLGYRPKITLEDGLKRLVLQSKEKVCELYEAVKA